MYNKSEEKFNMVLCGDPGGKGPSIGFGQLAEPHKVIVQAPLLGHGSSHEARRQVVGGLAEAKSHVVAFMLISSQLNPRPLGKKDSEAAPACGSKGGS